ncbi:MAG: hypothetical protein ACRYGC_02290 [Janthinobacterium lividum]
MAIVEGVHSRDAIMIFSRIRLHSPAAASRFEPLPHSAGSLATAVGVIRDSLAVLLASLAEHALAGLAHFPDSQRLPVDGLVQRDMPMLRRPPVEAYLATVSAPALPPSRKGWAVAARVAVAIVVAGGFGTLCLSYALACVTISSVLLGALA